MSNEFDKALRNPKGTVTVIKSPTGLGKTKLLENITSNPFLWGRVAIALPTHALKQELYNRLGDATRQQFVVTPELPRLDITQSDLTHLDYLYAVGAGLKAKELINRIAKCVPDVAAWKEELAEVLRDSDTKNLITTHEMAMMSDDSDSSVLGDIDTIIFDENPTNALMPMGSVSLKNLTLLAAKLEGTNACVAVAFIKRLIDYAMTGVPDPQEMQTLIPEHELSTVIEEIAKGGYDANDIIGLLTCSYYILSRNYMTQQTEAINFLKRRDFPTGKRIIVLSATANHTIYQRLFNERLGWSETPPVENVGRIIQDTKYSCSMSSLTNQKAVVYTKLELERLGVPPENVIIFKVYKTKDFGHPKMHFGKAEGSDELKGQDIAVVGTPYPNPESVILMAKALGATLNQHHLFTSKRWVQRHQYEFTMQTYDDDLLREIQLGFIESQLEQAIGRARILREDCTVYLFSGYPHPQAELTTSR